MKPASLHTSYRIKLVSINVFMSFIILFIIFSLPSIVKTLFGASSQALGLGTALILALIVYSNKLSYLRAVPISLILLIYFVTLHSALLTTQGEFFDSRAYISFIALCFVLLMAFFLSKLIFDGTFNVPNNVNYVFYGLVFLAFAAYVTDSATGSFFYDTRKSIFPFNEPSHFALVFGPYFLWYSLKAKTNLKGLLIASSIFILSILLESATLVIFCLLGYFILLRPTLIGVTLVPPVIIGCTYFVLSDPYFLSRLVLSPQSDNLTALVYLQGLTDAYNTLIDTNGWGLGFQMLGSQPPSDIAHRIQDVLGRDGAALNRKDGGFVAAKVVAEFGVLGLTLLLAYCFLLLKAFIGLRKVCQRPNFYPPAYVFSLVFIYSASVEIFVRGMGYFSPSLFFFFTALFVYNFYRR